VEFRLFYLIALDVEEQDPKYQVYLLPSQLLLDQAHQNHPIGSIITLMFFELNDLLNYLH
jgi:hypothetical protein